MIMQPSVCPIASVTAFAGTYQRPVAIEKVTPFSAHARTAARVRSETLP